MTSETWNPGERRVKTRSRSRPFPLCRDPIAASNHAARRGDRSTFGGERVELRRQVLGTAIERGELDVIRFGNLNAVALAQFHDNIQEANRFSY